MALIPHVLVQALAVTGGAVAAPTASEGADSLGALEPPEIMEAMEIAYPEGAPELAEPLTVEVTIRIGADGEVELVSLTSPSDDLRRPFNHAVLTAATHFRFRPARYQGEPVVVELRFQQTFLPSVAQDAEPLPDTPHDAVLSGTVIEKGTRAKVAFAEVIVQVGGTEVTTRTDEAGDFRLRAPAGEARVEVVAPEHHRFVVSEELRHNEDLRVEYLAERLSYSPYETVVIGKRERRVVSRTTLRDREIHHVPGTFGDPFRVVATLPGVSQVFSLLAYPIVRGSSPGNTGFLLDGVRVPYLFHMLAGPAVIHPEMIERVDFYPGTFPVEYGGYIGGIVDGITPRVSAEEGGWLADLSLMQAGLLYRTPIEPLAGSGTVAARFGYPFLMMEAFQTPILLSYWDYQARLDGRLGSGRWKVFAFGAGDDLVERDPQTGERSTLARTMFHRLDLSYHRELGEDAQESDDYKLVFGVDQTLAQSEGPTLTSWIVEGRARWRRALFPSLDVDAGLELGSRFNDSFTIVEIDDSNDGISSVDSVLPHGAAYVSAPWRPLEDLLVIPGVRFDLYALEDLTVWSADPRILARYRAAELLGGELWLKAGVGRYQGPPRFLVPIPGLDELAFEAGMVAATQLSAGAEMPLWLGFNIDAQVYYHHMDRVLFDLTINATQGGLVGGRREPGEELDFGDSGDFADAAALLEPQIGRSYGLEVLIKHEGESRFFGWLAYTLSWSDRLRDERWVPFDFDRRHVLNLVAGVSLPRNWDLGVRLQTYSGRPYTDARGFNQGRGMPFYRIDVRIDKRAVWRDWIFDFYVDLINVTLAPEELDVRLGAPVRIPLPSVGVRAVL